MHSVWRSVARVRLEVWGKRPSEEPLLWVGKEAEWGTAEEVPSSREEPGEVGYNRSVPGAREHVRVICSSSTWQHRNNLEKQAFGSI